MKTTIKRIRNAVIAVVLGGAVTTGAVYGYTQWQRNEDKARYMEYAVSHRHIQPEAALLEWGKIQYLKTHSSFPKVFWNVYDISYTSAPQETRARWQREYDEQFLK